MPTSNFKLFDENKANMLSDSEYNSNAQRLNGVQSGVASSQLQNKFQYQASLMAYAIAQLMVQNGYDATDTTAVTTFISNLSNTMLQKVADKANETQAKAGTDNTKWMTPALVKSAITELAPMVPAILSNETKALYGLGESAVPNDVLAALGKYKQYWWRRRKKPGESTWEYLHSTDRNAYPDSGTQDGYEYEYLGIPFDNAVTAPKIETGSYVGTGTYGQANPNTLTFGFKPKAVIISINGTSTYGGAIFMSGQTRSSYAGVAYNVDSSNMPHLTWNENSVSWYSTNRSYYQLNETYTYNYLAIG